MNDSADNPPDEPNGETYNPPPLGPGVSIVDELRSAYLDYAMSVIVSRAIPDLRDGLKPVHRRILYAMHETGNSHDKAFRKSARPVGDVMGKYHPHGDAAIYDALVRMAQDFSMSLPLLDGQGNFGSMDGDNPAAMRYTEVRMAKAAQWLLADIDRNTVTFQDNYDGKDQEPMVLPARFPNLLINGGGGIAVGMATNIPPHNLGEVIDATLALIDNPDISIEALMEHVPAPDFPTGGIIQGRHGAAETYATGRGKIVIRAKTRIEETQKDRQAIIIEEIPYQVNKASMIERIAQTVRDKKVEGISSIRDESDRSGVRVVIDLKRDATAEVVLNQLWKNSQMQTHFSCNMLALNGGRPERMPLDTILRSFVEFREEVVSRRTADELSRARERSHLLCGLAVAASNIDEVVHIIRSSSEPAAARERLQERSWPATEIADYVQLIDDPLNAIRDDGTYRLSDEQARAILELRLQRLTALGIRETGDELQKLAEKIRECLDILASASRIRSIIANELREVKELFAVPRRTQISEYADDIDDEDLIEPEDVVVTITNGGYIKRTPLTEFRAQKRGGKGISGMSTKNEDFVTAQYVVNTHHALLFFTTSGYVYKLKTWKLPRSSRNARGKAIVNILPIDPGVSIAAITPIDIDEEFWDDREIILVNSAGRLRRNRLSDFANVMSNGKIAVRLPEGVSLVDARICQTGDDVMLAGSNGQVIRFSVSELRIFRSRYSEGVRGIRFGNDSQVVAMEIIPGYDVTTTRRNIFLRIRAAFWRSRNRDTEGADPPDDSALQLDETEIRARAVYQEMVAAECLLLTISGNGSGKLSSSFDYRLTGRGGLGVNGMGGGGIVAFLTVNIEDQIMLTTNSGQSIRCRVADISYQSRTSSGVRIIRLAEGEEVVSVARINETVDANVHDDTEEISETGPEPHQTAQENI